jgi:hypothetical protein
MGGIFERNLVFGDGVVFGLTLIVPDYRANALVVPPSR